MLKIAQTKKSITTLSQQIAYLEKRIVTRAKMNLDNTLLEKKLSSLKQAKKKAEETLVYLEKKLADLNMIMMTTK